MPQSSHDIFNKVDFPLLFFALGIRVGIRDWEGQTLDEAQKKKGERPKKSQKKFQEKLVLGLSRGNVTFQIPLQTGKGSDRHQPLVGSRHHWYHPALGITRNHWASLLGSRHRALGTSRQWV